MENTITAPTVRDMKTVYRRKADEAFGRLMEISETAKTDIRPNESMSDQAEHMLTKVLQYGTCADAAKAIRYYAEYAAVLCQQAN